MRSTAGVLTGLVAAALTAYVVATTLSTPFISPATVALVVISVLLGPAILVILALGRRRKAALAAELSRTGSRAVAHVQGARPTGVHINNRPQVVVDYVLHPLDGSPSFPHRKTQTVSVTAITPRPGLAWPAWYSQEDPSKVAIGAPDGSAWDAGTAQLAREFGLTPVQMLGYDPSGGTPPSTPSLFPSA